MKDADAKVYFNDGREPEVIHKVTDIHKKAFHFVIFAEDGSHLYELGDIERIEVKV